MDKGDSSERDKPCLVLKYIVKFSPGEFANGLDVELREESRMTSKLLPDQLEKWSFYLLKLDYWKSIFRTRKGKKRSIFE